MPGLLRGVARTAVVAGTAAGVAGRVQRRQANRWATQDEQAYYEQQGRYAEVQGQSAPPQYGQPQYAQPQYAQPQYTPAPAAAPDPVAQLQQLAELKSQGFLTEEEFAAQKAKILS